MRLIKRFSVVTVCMALIAAAIFSVPAAAEVKTTRVEIEGGVTIRADAGTEYDVVGYTSDNTFADLLDSKNDTTGREWYHVLTDDKLEGYVLSLFAEEFDPSVPRPQDDTRRRVVIDNGVNIRAAAVSGEIVYFTPRFIEVALIDIDETTDPAWYHIETDWGLEGYVISTYCHIVPDVVGDTDGEIEYPPTDKYIMSTAMSVNVRKGAGLENDILGEIWPCKLPCYGVETDTDGMKWYKIYTPGGLYAYIREDFVEEYTYTEDPEFEKKIEEFPESYRDGLRHLHSKYPTWNFVADKLNVTLDEAVKAEAGYKALSNLYISISEDWRAEGPDGLKRGYRYASSKAVRYMMEPSNFIVSTGIFMFMDQSFDSKTQTKEGIKKMLEGTFMAGDEYAGYFLEAAEKSGVNPYALIGLVLQQTGASISEYTSGKNAAHPGYYNFYKLNASGFTEEEDLNRCLKYAIYNGWDTPKKAIIGGAVEYGENYVNFGQYTYYYKNFNVINEHYYFQFSMDILDQLFCAENIAYFCSENMEEITFRIPVYKVINPEPTPTPEPTPKSPDTKDGRFALLLSLCLASLLGAAATAVTIKKRYNA